MTATLRLIVPTLLAVLVLTGCQTRSAGVADVPPPPPADYYAPATPAPAPSDPFASPGYGSPAPSAGVVAPTPLGGAPAAGGAYVVQKGDTLYGIARKVYGDQSRWRDIAGANPGVDPNQIKAGQSLVLP